MSKRLTLATAAALLAALGLVPVLAMVADTFYVDGALSLTAYEALFSSASQLASMGRSMLLSLLTTLLATAVGVPLGLLLGKTDLPLRRTLATLFTVPLLMPPYVLATAWSAVLGQSGWVSRAVAPTTAGFLFSGLFGLYGCVGVLFTAFMPVVMLLTITHAASIDPRWEDAARLVSRWPRLLWRITLPLTAPSILFAAILVFLLTFGETGVPSLLRYRVYPVETLIQFAAFYDFGAATAAAMPMLLATLALLVLEYRWLHDRVLTLRAAARGTQRTQMALGRWRVPAFAVVSTSALLGVLLPLAVLVDQAASLSAYVDALARASDAILRSLAFAAIGATLLTVLGFFCGYLVSNRTLAIWRGVDYLALFLFTLPGTVIGIGLIRFWNSPLTNAIYGTAAIVIIGYLAQYAVLPIRITAAILGSIPSSLEQAARVAGASWFMTLRHVTAPLAKRGLLAAWLIGYVFCLRDVGTSIIVYPPGSDTLPVYILTSMANGQPSTVAALCVILIAITLLPLGVAAHWVARRAALP